VSICECKTKTLFQFLSFPYQRSAIVALYLQAPGAFNSGSRTFGDIRFSGRAVQQNIIRYDGVEDSAIIDASPRQFERRNPVAVLSSVLKNVQEFRQSFDDAQQRAAEFKLQRGR
jgi:hypothetical protein